MKKGDPFSGEYHCPRKTDGKVAERAGEPEYLPVLYSSRKGEVKQGATLGIVCLVLGVVLFMGQFIFILGGIRSGKSSYAVQLAKKLSKNVVFIATASASDKEMQKRIKLHKSLRPESWKTIEENEDVNEVLRSIEDKYKVVIIDCLGLLVSNLLPRDTEVTKKVKELTNIISRSKQTVILVSNNVGDSLVPDNPLGRRFVDLLGFANQLMAKAASQVIFMQAGIPKRLK